MSEREPNTSTIQFFFFWFGYFSSLKLLDISFTQKCKNEMFSYKTCSIAIIDKFHDTISFHYCEISQYDPQTHHFGLRLIARFTPKILFPFFLISLFCLVNNSCCVLLLFLLFLLSPLLCSFSATVNKV